MPETQETTTIGTGTRWDGKGGYITTFSGAQFMLASPMPEMVQLEDIAHALSMICHFGGHTAQFFSVAQHSVLVAKAARIRGFDREFCKWALMHDAPEAYLGDVTRPLKVLLPYYRTLEEGVMEAIAQKFGLVTMRDDSFAELKKIDDSILKLEAKMLMNRAVLHDGRGNPYDLPDPPPDIPVAFISPMNNQVAKSTFLREYEIIFNDDDGF